MATTPSGLSGHSAPSHVMEELNIARGNVIIHDRQMVGMTAEKWDKLRSTENVTHRIVQLMDVTLRGAAGVCVAGHVTGDISVVLVPVPIPRQNSVDETAGDWDLLHSHNSVTHKNAQVTYSH